MIIQFLLLIFQVILLVLLCWFCCVDLFVLILLVWLFYLFFCAHSVVLIQLNWLCFVYHDTQTSTPLAPTLRLILRLPNPSPYTYKNYIVKLWLNDVELFWSWRRKKINIVGLHYLTSPVMLHQQMASSVRSSEGRDQWKIQGCSNWTIRLLTILYKSLYQSTKIMTESSCSSSWMPTIRQRFQFNAKWQHPLSLMTKQTVSTLGDQGEMSRYAKLTSGSGS